MRRAQAAAVTGGGRPPTVELGYKERKELGSRHRKVERRIMEAEARQTELAAVMSDPAHATDYEILSAASSEAAALAERAGRAVTRSGGRWARLWGPRRTRGLAADRNGGLGLQRGLHNSAGIAGYRP